MDEKKFSARGIITIAIIWLVSGILSGFTVMQLWLWFIVPVFNLPALTFVQAIGLDLIVTFLVGNIDRDTDDMSIIKSSVTALVTTALFLIFGFLLQFFM